MCQLLLYFFLPTQWVWVTAVVPEIPAPTNGSDNSACVYIDYNLCTPIWGFITGIELLSWYITSRNLRVLLSMVQRSLKPQVCVGRKPSSNSVMMQFLWTHSLSRMYSWHECCCTSSEYFTFYAWVWHVFLQGIIQYRSVIIMQFGAVILLYLYIATLASSEWLFVRSCCKKGH